MSKPFAPLRVSVCLVAVPEVAVGVLHGLYETLSFVGSGWEMLTGWPPGPRRFQPRIVAETLAPFRNPAGLQVVLELTFADTQRADIVIVPVLAFGRDDDLRGRWSTAAGWLRQMHARGALICSVCTASIMLAEAGLLDGAEATCHWAAADQMREHYPEVRLRPERVIVPAGAEHRVVTAGGAALWTDLVLYLVARFCGEEEARRTAKLFLFGDRSDGQLPFAARVRPRQHGDAAVAATQLWIADNYACANPVSEMTHISGLAPRTFKRRFIAATGYAPMDYVQSLRIEEAKQMLETTNTPIDEISASTGYGEPAAFRRIFKRATGIAPSQYRRRFRAIAVAWH